MSIATEVLYPIPSHLLPIPAHLDLTPLMRDDKFIHVNARESGNIETVKTAWRIHAEGYHAMGFVNRDAITPEGFLAADIDKSRGENTDYYIAVNAEDVTDCATMRKVSLPAGGSYRDLPTYKMCKDSFSEEGLSLLAGIEHQDTRLKEISALARTVNGSPLGIHEIFRDLVQAALGKHEIWFSAVVSSTHGCLVKSYGRDNFPTIGRDTAIDDDRVGDGIALTPILIDVDRWVDVLLEAYLSAEDIVGKTRARKSLMFFTDGLQNSLMSQQVIDVRRQLLRGQAA